MASMKSSTNLSSYQYYFGMLGTSDDQVSVYDGSSLPIGVIQDIENTSTGSATDVAMLGGCAFVKLAGTVAKGKLVAPDASGLGIAATVGGSVACARALEAGVADDVIAVELLTPRAQALETYTAIWDFSVDGGAIGTISSDTTVPAGFIIQNAFYIVNATCTSSTDAGTLGIGVETLTAGSEDLVNAAAISTGTTWDASGSPVQMIPDFATVGDQIVVSANSVIRFNTAVEAFTAGKISVFVQGVQGV